jgi:hypothetical protein
VLIFDQPPEFPLFNQRYWILCSALQNPLVLAVAFFSPLFSAGGCRQLTSFDGTVGTSSVGLPL